VTRVCSPFTYEDRGRRLGPNSSGLWKPAIAAVVEMACGSAFDLLSEADALAKGQAAFTSGPRIATRTR
jgi:hypothetical protein